MSAIIISSIMMLLVSSTTSFTAKPTTTTNNMFAINRRCKVKPDLRDKFLTAIKEHQQSTRRNEDNNLQFIIGQDVDDENTLYIHEEFTNLSAFQDHRMTSHSVKFDEFMKVHDPLEEAQDMCFYHPREEDEDTMTTKRPINKDSFGLNVNLYPKESVRDEFLEVISNNKQGTDETEKLALQYTYGESVGVEGIAEGSPNTFHFHEQYIGKNHGKEGFDAHATMPHFAAWEDFVGTDPFSKDPEVYFFKILE